MALVVADRVKETTTTTGTGAITLAGATTNFVTFSSVLSNGDTTYYAIVDDANTDFEVGLGTYASSGNTLTRTTVLSSTNSGSAVNLSAGSKEVFITYPADKSVNRDASGNVSVSGGVTATSFTGNVTGAVTATQVDLTGQGDLRLQDASGGQYVALQAPATVGSSFTFTLPSADGSANQLLQTDGSGNLSFTTINTSPSFSATASGALADGDLVVVNSDGTVSVVETESANSAQGSEVVFETGATVHVGAGYDANAGKVVIVFNDDGDSGKGKAVIGTVSGTSISFGTAVEFNSSGYTSDSRVTYDSNAQKVVITYRDNSDSNKGKAIVGTVSGTSISFGSEVDVSSSSVGEIEATYDANAQKIVAFYKDTTNSSYGYSAVGTVSGTSISFGTPVALTSTSVEDIAIVYDANAQKVVVGYKTGNNGESKVGTVSGTSISGGSQVQFNTGSTQFISLAYDENAQKILVSYEDPGNQSRGASRVGTISGTSISYGTEANWETASGANPHYIRSVYDATAQKVVIAYEDDSQTNDYGQYVDATIDGTTVSFTSPGVFNAASTEWVAIAYDSGQGKIVIGYKDSGNSNQGTAVVRQTGYTRINLTSENYIGISNGAYSNGATATVQIAGSVDDAQSSLTAGQQYFVQANGSLGLTADNPSVIAGTAVSATKIIVKG